MGAVQPDATKLESRIRLNVNRLRMTAPAVTQEQGIAAPGGETEQFASGICRDIPSPEDAASLTGELEDFAPDICGDISSPRRITGPLLVGVRRLLRFLLWPFLGRQIIVNRTIARILEAQTASMKRVGILLAELNRQCGTSLADVNREFGASLASIDRELETSFTNINRELVVLRNRTVGMRRQLYQSTDANAKLYDEVSRLSDSNTKVYGELSKLRGELSAWIPRDFSEIDRPVGAEVPFVDIAFRPESGEPWYPPPALGPWTVASRATRIETIRKVIEIAGCLVRDEIIEYLLCFYEHGLAKFGTDWRFADIATTLVALSELIKPAKYLEVGVFHGRSMAMIGATSPQCELFGFDLWIPAYASQPNPGPDLVREQLKRVGHIGPLTLVSGDSHETLPRFLAEHPDLYFDVITVDGDHTAQGAAQDLRDVMPRLKLGGFLVFDDIMHAETRYLWNVWSQVVAADPRFVTWAFREMGNGIALAMKLFP